MALPHIFSTFVRTCTYPSHLTCLMLEIPVQQLYYHDIGIHNCHVKCEMSLCPICCWWLGCTESHVVMLLSSRCESVGPPWKELPGTFNFLLSLHEVSLIMQIQMTTETFTTFAIFSGGKIPTYGSKAALSGGRKGEKSKAWRDVKLERNWKTWSEKLN